MLRKAFTRAVLRTSRWSDIESIVYTPKKRTILRLSDRGPTTSLVAVSSDELESLEAAPTLEVHMIAAERPANKPQKGFDNPHNS